MALFRRIEDINVWQEGMLLAEHVYSLVRENKQLASDFGLRDQLQRSSVSIPSNIAEGFERESRQEFIRFLLIAKGSSGELRTQLTLAHRLKYIHSNEYVPMNDTCTRLSKMISSLIKTLRNKSPTKQTNHAPA